MESKEVVNKVVLEALKDGRLDKETCYLILKELNQKKTQDDIAIIGMSGKYAKADNLEQYWSNLLEGVEAIGAFPESREKLLGRKIWLKAGFIEGIDLFDPDFFEMTEEEARETSPTHRIFLEKTWEALEDAGYTTTALKDIVTGVYVGLDSTHQISYENKEETNNKINEFGSATALLASRVSYFLNIKGPSMMIDSMCSSGAIAVHLACAAIREKECQMAIAGGINILDIAQTRMQHINSQDSKVAVFDKNASGMVWGEGCGVVILKSLNEALKDGDQIYAVIKGSEVNNDGKTSELTSPNFKTQALAIRRAWEKAKIDPETISYIETNGTGTLVGDSIEYKGIKESFEKYTNKKQFCGIGSVKPSIGHGIAVSGISSLQKVVLSLVNEKLAPTIQFKDPNPLIEFSESPCYINDSVRSWKRGEMPRRAGVNSFSFTRTNCHIVLEEAPLILRGNATEVSYVFLLSARSGKGLLNYIKKYNKFFETHEELCIKDVCYTAAVGREHYDYRLAVIAKDMKDLSKKMQQAEKLYMMKATTNEMDHIYFNTIIKNANNRRAQEEAYKQTNKRGLEILQMHEEMNMPLEVLDELGKLYTEGMNIDWKKYFVHEKYFRLSLPTYVFNKKHYWREEVVAEGEEKEAEATQENEPSIVIKGEFSDLQQIVDERSVVEEVHITGREGDYSEVETKLAYIWGSALEQTEIPIDQSFSELGGGSLGRVKVELGIENEFDIDMDEEDVILDYSNIENQAIQVERIVEKQSDNS